MRVVLFFALFSLFSCLKIQEICHQDDLCEMECTGGGNAGVELGGNFPKVSDLQIYDVTFREEVSLADFLRTFPNLKSLDLRASKFAKGFDCGDDPSTPPVLMDCSVSQDPNLKNAPGYGRSVCSCFGTEFIQSEKCFVSVFTFQNS